MANEKGEPSAEGGSGLDQMAVLQREHEELKAKYQQLLRVDAEKLTIKLLLQERLKELSCLYNIADVVEKSGKSIEKIMQGVVELIPPAWQYPELTRARIILEQMVFVSADFKTSKWVQSSDIRIDGKPAGQVEVYYLETMPTIDEGPFLKEERLLIDSICGRLGRACERIRAEAQLKTEQLELRNKNIALREVLSRVQEEKKETNDVIVANVDKIIMPIIYELEGRLPDDYRALINLLKTSLLEITSPFIDRISHQIVNLTPTEIQICHMVKNGLQTKDISKMRHIAPATINRHRENIRKKLGISNKSINLTSYLKTIMER